MSREPRTPPSDAGPPDLRRRFTIVWSIVMIVLGIAIVVRTLVNGGGALAVGLVAGLLFAGAGAGRLWISGRGYL